MSLVAWKVLRVNGDGTLVSPVYRTVWPADTGTIKAECQNRVRPRSRIDGVVRKVLHRPPEVGCESGGYGCGIYSALTVEQVRGWVRPRYHFVGADGGWVVARLEVWGRTVPHEIGYRSQYARLTGVVGDGEVERVAAERYGLPLLVEEEANG